MLCTVCNAKLPADARFCSQCGERVPQQNTLPGLKDAEHKRLLTILFCDLVDSTAMSNRHEPEIYSAIVRGYLYDATEKLEAYGGQIARYIGDGIMAYFGYPQAQSDDVERAVLASLNVIRMIKAQPPVNGEKLSVRMGIATGLVVIGTSAGRGIAREQVAMGTTPNLAARVQAVAGADQVGICPRTHTLLGNRFRYHAIGEHTLKGFTQPVQVRTVISENEGLRRSRFRAIHGDNPAPLVGRESELQTLLNAPSNNSGKPVGVLIRGQAGMGKSRLLHAYRTSDQTRKGYYLETQCDSYRSSTFLHPFIKLLADLAHFDLQQRSESHTALAELLKSLALDDPSTLEILSEFVESGDSSRQNNSLPPEGRQSRIYAAITSVLHTVARFSPVAIVFEDLHWADASTLELLSDLLNSKPQGGHTLRLIMTTRPDISLGKLDHKTLCTVDLHPLSEPDTLQLAQDILGETTVPDALVDQIVDRSAGVPLFLEALCRQVAEAAQEHNDTSLNQLKLPATIQGLVMEQLDRLQSKALAVQLAATLGMRFAADWLRDILHMCQDDFDSLLESCQHMHLLSVTVSAQGTFCTFQHALIQQVAYESMLRIQSQQQHDAVARYFESQHPDICRENPEMLGQHWQRADNWEKGAEYLLVASERSAATWANASAIQQIQSVIALLEENRCAQPRWNDLWYKAHVRMGGILVAQQRVDDAQQCYETTLDACRDNPRRVTKLFRRIAEAQQRNKRIANQAIQQARRTLPDWADCTDQHSWWQESLQLDLIEGLVAYWHNDTPTLEKALNRMSGVVEKFGTPQQQAEVHAHLMLLDMRKHRYRITPDALQHGQHFVSAAKATNKLDRAASALFQEGFALLFDGQYQSAQTNFLEAQQLALECGIKSVQVQVLVYLGIIYRCTGDVRQTEVTGAQGLALARETEMKDYEAMALANLAWCAWHNEDFYQLDDLARQALSLWQSLPFQYPFQWAATLPLLALACVQNNQIVIDDMLRQLVADSQQLLPETVDELLQTAVRVKTRQSIADLLRAASQQGLLFTPENNRHKYFSMH